MKVHYLKHGAALIVCLAVLISSQVSSAAIYKWVDENGNVTYSEVPPPKGQNAQRVKEPPPPPVDPDQAMQELRDRAEAFGKRRDDRKDSEEEAQESAAQSKAQKSTCDILRKNLASLTSKNQVKEKAKDGSYTTLSEEQRQAKIKKSRQRLAKECK